MNRTDRDAIYLALAEELARSDSEVYANHVTEAHPELQDLALYVDGGLSESARQGLEEHFAICTPCRRTVMETGLAVADRKADADQKKPDSALGAWWSWRPALGLAAGLVAVVIGLSWLRPATPTDAARLVEVGVPIAAIDAAGPELARRAVRALAGQWSRPAGFERFLTGDRPVMRGASTALAPLPVAPRWSIISVERPWLTWRLDRTVAKYEILIVDEGETLFATFSVPATETVDGEVSVLYPPDAAPPVPGKAYAWKVNALIDGEWVASPYVPFIRASLEDQARHEAELTRSEPSPLLRAVALASAGRYRPALQALQHIDEPQRGRLIASVLGLQHFSAQDLERERQRWAISSEPQ